jgi:putative membrane protein (TIGR04086 family)
MGNFKKNIQFFLYVLLSIFIWLFFTTILYHFNILGSNIVTYLNIIILAIIIFISSFKLGVRSIKRTWTIGLKFGLILIAFFFIFSFLALNSDMHLKVIIYYLILLGVGILGSMYGISKNPLPKE